MTDELCWGELETLKKTLLDRDPILPGVITTYKTRQKFFARLRAANVFNHLRWVEFQEPRAAREFVCHGHTMPSR